MEYYILLENKKWFLNKVEDGYLLLQNEKNEEKQIDLAIVNRVMQVCEDKDISISITQYLILTNQLKQGNEWETNKWIVYLFFSILCSIINGLFCIVGLLFTLYTMPLFLISSFCCFQLYKIEKKKMSIILFILSILVFTLYPINNYIYDIYFSFIN